MFKHCLLAHIYNMAVNLFDSGVCKDSFSDLIRKAQVLNEISILERGFAFTLGSEAEKKLTLEQAFRDVFNDLIGSNKNVDIYESFINLAVEAVKRELCSGSLPVLMMSDMFDSTILEKCEALFTLVELHVEIWKSEPFYSACRNFLLRMCNDLLRRLSRSQNTVFCGRILLFLAKLFPLSERSGLNLISEFNLENITVYGKKNEDNQHPIVIHLDSNDVEEGEMDELGPQTPIDYNLYYKFWSLQDFFRNPNQFYNKDLWKDFAKNAQSVFQAFNSAKLDDIKSSKKKLGQNNENQKHMYFAKYLTSQKLLDLQLSDSTFRRYVLVQFLIKFQYLNASVKFKAGSHVLTEEQNNWIKEATNKVYQLLRETPPDGVKFAETIQHILNREEKWSAWKNEGCPDIVKDKASVQSCHVARKRIGDELRAIGSNKKINLGNPELTRLWNLCPDNLEACRTEKRDFLPSLESFFEEAIEQADPENQIEEKYKMINNSNYGWKALRLLARRSPHFFTQSNQPAKSLPLYLSSMVMKLAKELPQATPHEEIKNEVAGAADESEDELLKNNEENSNTKEDIVPEEKKPIGISKEQFQAISEKIGSSWKKLALKLKFHSDEIAYFESENSNIRDQALNFLIIWQEQEMEDNAPVALATALREIGYGSIAESVFGKNDEL